MNYKGRAVLKTEIEVEHSSDTPELRGTGQLRDWNIPDMLQQSQVSADTSWETWSQRKHTEKQGQQGTHGKNNCRAMKDDLPPVWQREWFKVGNKHRNSGTQHHQLPSFNSKQSNLDSTAKI